jgi:cyclic pyranopterin phosphate synthase
MAASRLLHPDLPHVVERAVRAGIGAYVTTNGLLLAERIDELVQCRPRAVDLRLLRHRARLRRVCGARGNFARLERGIAAVRERHGSKVRLRMNWLLMRPSCSLEALQQAWQFALRYDTPMQVDLVHYSLPYFTEGAERELQFTPEDRPRIERVVEHCWRGSARIRR